MRQDRRTLTRSRGPWHLVRRVAGYTCLGIGVIGAILPIIPGWPGFFLAVALLGRRDRTLRLAHLLLRHCLRYLRRTQQPVLRRLGLWASAQYLGLRRQLLPHLDRAERFFGVA
jgi:hypothetical protein